MDENKKFLEINTRDISDNKLKELVELYISGCQIQKGSIKNVDITSDKKWSEGEEKKLEALIKLYDQGYINLPKQALDNCLNLYFWNNFIRLNGTDINLYFDEDNKVCYDAKIQNNTGVDIKKITFISAINNKKSYKTVNDFYDGNIKTITFMLDKPLKKGLSISNSFYVKDYELYGSNSYNLLDSDYEDIEDDDYTDDLEDDDYIDDLDDIEFDDDDYPDNEIEFTNGYGDSSTLCNHEGCYRPIAKTGNTNCCEKHSNKCLECGKYCDEDATWCIDCIIGLGKSSDSESIYGDNSSYSNKESNSSSGSYSGGWNFN